MQQSPLTLRQRLIDAVDESYHVKDMGAIVEVLGTLERLAVTKELLETTRLGKTVNEFRKRINDEKLAKRAKALVKKWRDAVLTTESAPPPVVRVLNGNSSDGAPSSFPNQGPLREGYNSNSSSPKLMPSSKVSPNATHNSNSLSPRVLSNLPTTNTSLSRNGQRPVSFAVSSPGFSSSSPSLRLSSPSMYNNKTKSPFEPTISSQTNNKTLTNSYAPNIEVVARTNAANKRLRIDDSNVTTVDAGPPLKKAKVIPNGGFIEGTLDDPSIVLDDLSKDSIASRASENSDGSSSKPVSNISSGAVLSAAPSPLSITQDSNHSPPLLIDGGIGAESSEALISHDDSKTSFFTIENDISSAANLGANDQLPAVTPEARQPAKRGRRKKENHIIDAATLLHQQIAAAQQQGKIRPIQRVSVDICEDEPPRTPGTTTLQTPKGPPQQTATLSTADPVMKNEFVEKYLQSQTELRTKMEQQYQDAVKRHEIVLEPSPSPLPTVSVQRSTEVEIKKKKKKDKRKNKDGPVENIVVFATESEILFRLPPIDPQILEDFKNFQFDVQPKTEEQEKPKSETETEILTSPNSINETKAEINDGGIISKIDWGDSEDENDDFMEVVPAEEATSEAVDTSGVSAPIQTSSSDATPMIVSIDTPLQEQDAPPPVREISDMDVDRLHFEKVENLNGNMDRDNLFKEWHEVLTMEPCKGELLHILPYTIIDF